MCSEFTYNLVKKHEGWKNHVYLDTKGIKTIGVGFNLEAQGAQVGIAYVGADYASIVAGAEDLNDNQIGILFNRSLAMAEAGAYTALTSAKYSMLKPAAQSVVIDMIYTMGLAKFKGFKNFI